MVKKNKLALLTSMMLIGSISSESGYYNNTKNNVGALDNEPKEPKPDWLIARQNGLREWNFNGIIVYAATKKKALKLYEKLK